jgi:NAD(P)-dependent dehydrogenase (short-subunit alcohol dehydrogenase family)
MTGLTGRPVLVTGAASGIGEATAMRLAREGAAVALVDRDAERLGALKDTLAGKGGRVLALPGDVGDETAVQAAIDATVRAFGGLRGIVTSAGIFDPGDMQPLAGVRARRVSSGRSA